MKKYASKFLAIISLLSLFLQSAYPVILAYEDTDAGSGTSCTLSVDKTNVTQGESVTFTLTSGYGYSAYWGGSNNDQPIGGNYPLDDFPSTSNSWQGTYRQDTTGIFSRYVEILNEEGNITCTTNTITVNVISNVPEPVIPSCETKKIADCVRRECDPGIQKMVCIDRWQINNGDTCDIEDRPGIATDQRCGIPQGQDATTPTRLAECFRQECDQTANVMVCIDKWNICEPEGCTETEKPGRFFGQSCVTSAPPATTQPADTRTEPAPITTYPGEPICSLSAIPQPSSEGKQEVTWTIYADPIGQKASWKGPDLGDKLVDVEEYPSGSPYWSKTYTYTQPATYTREAVINYSSAQICTTNPITVTINSPSVGAAAVEPDINITNESRQLADINQDVAVTTDQPPPDLPPIADPSSQGQAEQAYVGAAVQRARENAEFLAEARQAGEEDKGNTVQAINSAANNVTNVGLGVAGAVGGTAGNLFTGIGQLFQPQNQKQAEEAIKKAEGIYVEPNIPTGIPAYCSAGDFNGTPETNPECYPQQRFERAKETGERTGFKVEGDYTNFGISLTGTTDLSAYTILNQAPVSEEEKEASRKSAEALAKFVVSLLPGGAYPELVEKSNQLAAETFVVEAVCKQAGFVDASYVRSLLAQTPKSGQKQRKEILELGQQVNPQFKQQVEETRALTYEGFLARTKVQDPSLEGRLAEISGLSREEAKAKCSQETTALETKIKDLNTEVAANTALELVTALPVAEAGAVVTKAGIKVAKPFVRRITDPIGNVAKKAWDTTLGRFFGGAGKEVAQESAEKTRPQEVAEVVEKVAGSEGSRRGISKIEQSALQDTRRALSRDSAEIQEITQEVRTILDSGDAKGAYEQARARIQDRINSITPNSSKPIPPQLLDELVDEKVAEILGWKVFYHYTSESAAEGIVKEGSLRTVGETYGEQAARKGILRAANLEGPAIYVTDIKPSEAQPISGGIRDILNGFEYRLGISKKFGVETDKMTHYFVVIAPEDTFKPTGSNRILGVREFKQAREIPLEGPGLVIRGPFKRGETPDVSKILKETPSQKEAGSAMTPDEAIKTPDQPLYVGGAQSIPTQVTSGLKEAVDRIVPKDLGRPARQRLDEIISYETEISDQIVREVGERGGVYIPPTFEDKAEVIRQIVPDLWSGSTRIIRRGYSVYIQQYSSEGLVREMPLVQIPRGMVIFPSKTETQGKLIRVYRGGNIGGFNQPQLAPILRDGSVTVKDIDDLREGRISLETLASKISNPDERRLAETAIEWKREILEKTGEKASGLELLIKVHQDCERGVNCGSVFVSTTTDPLTALDFTMGGYGFNGVLVLDIPESQIIDFNKIRYGHAVEGGEQETGVFGEIKPEWIRGFIFKDSNMTGAQFTKTLADFDRAVENPEAYYAVLTKQGGRGAVQESVPKGAFQPINLSDKEAIKNLAEKAFPDGEMVGKGSGYVSSWIYLGATEDLIQKKADQARRLVDYMFEGGGVPTEGIRTARPPGPDAPQEIKDAWQALRFDGGFEAREGTDFKRGDLVVAVTDALISQHINVRDPKMAAVLNKANSKLEELGAYVAQNNPYPHPQSTAYRVGNEQVHVVSDNQFDRILKRPEAAGFTDGDQIVLRQGVASRDEEDAIRVVLHECTHTCQFTLANRTEIQQVFRTLGVDNFTKLDEGVTEFATQFVSDNAALREAMRSDQLLAPLVSSTKEQYKIWAYRDLVAAVHDELIPEIMRNNGFSREQASAIVINTVRNGQYTELLLSVRGADKLNEIFGKFPEIVGNTSARSTRAITPTDKQLALLKAKAEISAGSPPEEIPKSLPWRLVGSVFAQEEKVAAPKVLDTSTLEALTKKELIKNALIEDGQVDASFVKEVAKTEIFTAETGRTPNGYILATGKSGLVEGNLEQDKYKVEIASIPGVDIKIPGVVEVKAGQETVIPVAIKKGTGKVEKTVPPTGWQWLLNKLFGTVFAQENKESQVQLMVFSDTNNNGKIDKDEQVLPWAGLTVELKKVNQERILSLNPGWNLVALEVLPAKPLNASTLLQEIAKQGGYATTVSVLENGAWKSFVVRGDKTYSGDDFPITPGKAYFVKALKPSMLVYQGQELVAPIKLKLTSGWNGVGVPYSEKPYQAADFIDTLNTKEARADTASRWESGLWDTFVKLQDQRYGENFMIEQGRGYLLKVAKGLEFSP